MFSFWKWCIDTCNVMICCIKVRLFWRCVWFARIWHVMNLSAYIWWEFIAGPVIGTSHDLGPKKGSWGKDIILFQGDLGWWNILTIYIYIFNVFFYILTPYLGKIIIQFDDIIYVSNGLVKNHQLDTASRRYDRSTKGLLFQERPKSPSSQLGNSFAPWKKVIQTIGFWQRKGFQQTPKGTYPRPSTIPVYSLEIISYFVFWGTWGLWKRGLFHFS